ncbi:hypothetical protein OAT79_00020 [Gammaproteobacteria bacterium]|nr:hypothetical protein [Gammaproteobacteria bacterium]
MKFSLPIDIFKDYTKHILLIGLTPILIGIIYSLILQDQFTTSATVSPKRSTLEQSNSGSGLLSAFSNFDSDNLSPELKFATNYFYSYKFLSSFLIEHDLIDEMLAFKKFDKKNNKNILQINSSSFEVKNLLSSENPTKGLFEVQKATKELRKILKFVPARDDPTLAILEVTHYSPALSFYIATEILNNLDRDIAAIDIKSSDSQISYITSILGDYSSIETNNILASMLDREFTKKILANSSDQYAFLVLDPPVFPIQKSMPRRSAIILLSILMGVFLNSIFLAIIFIFNQDNHASPLLKK